MWIPQISGSKLTSVKDRGLRECRSLWGARKSRTIGVSGEQEGAQESTVSALVRHRLSARPLGFSKILQE